MIVITVMYLTLLYKIIFIQYQFLNRLYCSRFSFLTILAAYTFTVMHDLHLIHTDLKPENILLVSPEYIKIPDYKVDLGKLGFYLLVVDL